MDSVAATGFGVNEFGEKAVDAPQDESTVYVLEQTQCAQATLPNQLAALAELGLHALVGTCADQGYSVAEGSKTLTLPGGLGDVTFSLYKKASASFAIPSYQPMPELGLQLGMLERPSTDGHRHNGGNDEHGHGHGNRDSVQDSTNANANANANANCPFKKCFELVESVCHLSRHQRDEKLQCMKDHAADFPAECQFVVA